MSPASAHPFARRTAAALSAAALALTGAGTAHAASGTGSPSVTASSTAAKSGSAAAQNIVLTEDQAQVQARKTGKPVAVPSAETSTSTLTAEPNGQFSLSTNAQPVRKLVGGAWQNLDPTLRRNPDGTVSPVLTGEPLALSGGGTAALATMHSGAESLAISLPVSLPKPTLSGDEATYTDVAPGVDLVVTVNSQGGFSDVFVVHSAAAAASPAFAHLLTAGIKAQGLKVSTDSQGDLLAKDANGDVAFSAAAPGFWDSSSGPSAATTAATGTPLNAADSAPAGQQSTVLAAGVHAHRGSLATHLNGSTLTLTPDPAVLDNPAFEYPAYMDPSWNQGGGTDPVGNSNAGWGVEGEGLGNNWDSSAESGGQLQVGEAVGGGLLADTLLNFNLPLNLLGNEGTTDTITGATLDTTVVASSDCSTTTADLYAPSTQFSTANDNWNSWFTSNRSDLGPAIGSASIKGVWSSCTSTEPGDFNNLSTAWITNDVNAGKSVQTLALAGSSYSAEVDETCYNLFDPKSPVLNIYFSHSPDKPTNLSTSPDASTIGNGNVTLNADVADPDGGTLGVGFDAYITGNPTEPFQTTSDTQSGATTSSPYADAGSGSPTSMTIYQNTLNGALTNPKYGGTAGAKSMSVTWTVMTIDADGQTSPTATSTFTYSTAVPGAPNIDLEASDPDQTDLCSPTNLTTAKVGTGLTLYLSPVPGATVIPTGYTYQLGAASGQTVSALPTTGDAIITIVPTSQAEVLTVNAIAAGSNVGEAGTCTFSAGETSTAGPGDLTGDGVPDLLVPGTGTDSLPSGAWLAPGTAAGQVSADPVNIGLNGNGASATDESPATFNGDQLITGLFKGAPGFNDVLAYDPTIQAANKACSGSLLTDYGDSTPLVPVNVALNSTDFTLNGGSTSAACATSVANGGDLTAAEGSGSSPITSFSPAAVPDLLMVVGANLYLNSSAPSSADYGYLGSGYVLDTTGPTGTGWAGWTIATAVFNDIPAMFAVNEASGAVYYYSPTAMAAMGYNFDNDPTTPLTSTPVHLTGTLASGSYTELQGTAINGTPALWSVSPTGTVTTYELNSAGTALTQVESTGTPMNTATHSWPLNDAAGGAELTTAVDSAGGMTLTGNAGVTGNTSDALFSPDAAFDGSTGYLTSSGGAGAINPNADWTVSLWAKPTALGGTVLSQNGTNDPVVQLTANNAGAWQLNLNTTATGTAATYYSISGGSVRLGLWTHLTATYSKETGILTVYADGNEIALGTDTAPPTPSTGTLLLGATQPAANGNPVSGYFAGQLADVQEDDSVAAPLPATIAGSDFVPVTPTRILDTRNDAVGGVTGPVGAGATVAVTIAGSTTGGLSIPSAGVTAAAVSITEVGATGSGDVTAYPDQTPIPVTSNLNYIPSAPVTNNGIIPVGADGKIALNNNGGEAGSVQLIVDITGYFTTATGTTNASTYEPLGTPTRILDTRNGVGAPTAKLGADQSLKLAIAGNDTNGAGLPADGAAGTITAVAINLTATNETGAGFLIAYPDGATLPNTTNVTYSSTGPGYSSTVIVPVSALGFIDIYNASTTSVDVIGDVSGYYTTGTSGQHYYPVGSTRLVDTRQYNPHLGSASPVSGQSSINLAVPANITAYNPTLVLNVTATQGTTIGVMGIYPGNQSTVPAASALNWNLNSTVANLSLAYADGGSVNFYNAATGSVHLIVDTNGYFD